MIKITSGDFLAGGGGVTEAMSQVQGMQVKWVLNHDQVAIRTNLFHHHHVKHYWADLYKQDEKEMEAVDFVWASIECTQHSQANGGREKKIGSYTLGWELVRYIKYLQPMVIGIENVPEFKKWAPLTADGFPDKNRKGEEFERWKQTVCALGYDYSERIMNAADYGIPTRRVRFFAFFTQKGLIKQIPWPEPTHNRDGSDGLKKWEACKNYIDLDDEGQSIFGRKFNPKISKGKRVPLVVNTLKRIAGGIKKEAPELHFILQYYGSGLNSQSVNKPLNTIRTKDCHALITVEKKQFIQDHCHLDHYNSPNDPLNPILTWETKQLVTVEKIQFLQDYYGRDNTSHPLDGPANTITTENSKHLVTVEKKMMVQHFTGEHSSNLDLPLPTITTKDHNALVTAKAQFISQQFNSNGNPGANNKSINDPLNAILTEEKFQFITAYFNSSGNQGSQNQSLENPLGTILTGTNKKALITAMLNGEFDFDIKMRFLYAEEMSKISTFPDKYFTDPRLKLSSKEQIRLIGNAVPVEWARQIIEPVVKELQKVLTESVAV